MRNNQLDTANQDELSGDENAKLQKRRHELIVYQKFITERYYHSILNFIGYTAAGAVLWFLMQGQFAAIWPVNADIPSNELRVKDLWNVAMYVVPFLFWGMATKHASIVVIGILDIFFSEFKLSRLKKKLGKNAQ